MKILLVRPISEKATNIIPLLGLGYLAGALRRKGHEAKYLDCVKDKLNLLQFIEFVRENKFDYIGFQVFSCDVTSTLNMICEAKKMIDTKIVVGGPHISGKPDFILNDGIDYGFQGEAEIGFPMLVQGRTLKEIPGLIYKKDKRLFINEPKFEDNIDQFKVAWDLIKPDTYPIAPHGSFVKTPPSCAIMTTRGCCFDCQYCAGKKSTGAKLRKRSIKNIMKEIKLLYNQYGIREIHIEDDNFTLDSHFVIDFCNAVTRWTLPNKINLSFACPNGVRLETLNEEVLMLMEEAGFYSFAVGIESGNNRILKKMNRNVTKEKIKEKIELIASKTNIRMTGFCMMGYPTETINEMEETASFTRSLPIHKVQYGNFHPLPGTPIYDELVKSGEYNPVDKWDQYQDNTISYSPKGVTPEQLKKVMSKSFRKFYFRPKIVLGLLGEIKNWEQFKVLVKRGLESFA